MNAFNLIFMFFKRIRAIPNFLKDSNTSFIKKIIVIGGLIYLISPIDLIPFPVLGFSVIDDLVLWIFIISMFSKELDKYDFTNRKKYSFDKKKIIKDVEYHVKNNKDNKK